MIRRPRHREGESVLPRELLDALLADLPSDAEVAAMNADVFTYDVFERFTYSLRQLAELRIAHRALLLQEAERRGLAPGHLDKVRAAKSDDLRLKERGR